MSPSPGRALGSDRVALYLGEIAQETAPGKQRSGTMMALHSRSCALFSGMRVPQTLMPTCSVNHVAEQFDEEPSKKVSLHK